MSAPPDSAAIVAALERVADPCSMAVNAPTAVTDMGLIRGWEVDARDVVRVILTPTTPSCVLVGSIARAIEEVVGAVPGVSGVHVELDLDTLWTPELMSPAARGRLAERKTGPRRVAVRPQEWRRRPSRVAPA